MRLSEENRARRPHKINKMDRNKVKTEKRERRHRRIRAKISGTDAKPRISIFKSNKGIYAQLIDDVKGVTLAASSTSGIKGANMIEKSKEAGKELAKKALEKKIEVVVFDRGGYIFTGQVKALADGAREGGLKF
jgi:large subunit ribosomal protein L18